MMRRRSSLLSTGILLAYAAALGMSVHVPRTTAEIYPVKRRNENDPEEEKYASERLKAAQAKRERKAAKRRKEAK